MSLVSNLPVDNGIHFSTVVNAGYIQGEAWAGDDCIPRVGTSDTLKSKKYWAAPGAVQLRLVPCPIADGESAPKAQTQFCPRADR